MANNTKLLWQAPITALIRKQAFRFFTLVVMLVFCITSYQPAVSALSQGQKDLYDRKIYYFNSDDCAVGSVASRTSSSVSNIYMIGDSVTVGAYYLSPSDLKKAFDDRGWSSQVDARGARSMIHPGQEEVYGDLPGREMNGLDAIKADSDAIKSADTVIIALGTNVSGSTKTFKEQAETAIQEVRNANTNANIYWLNISAKQGGTRFTQHVDEYNKVIDQVASDKNIRVIDAASANIELYDDIHPSSGKDGTQKLSGVIVDALSAGSPSGPTQLPAGCCDTQSGSLLAGSNNEEKVWNFLISKNLSTIQAAAVLGNLVAEGHDINPRQVERGDYSKPPYLSDTIPPSLGPQGQPGYGIAQWTSSNRKAGLQKMADETNRKVYDLDLQLDFMWSEVESSTYRSRVYEPLIATNDLAEAVRIWQDNYEVGENFEPRHTAAKAVLRKYGNNGSVAATAASSPGSGGGCACTVDGGSLDAKLSKLAEENGGKTSISVSAIDGSVSGQANGDVQMDTRSSYKLYTAYATLRAIESGKIKWSDKVTTAPEDADKIFSSGSTLLAMEKMIVNSSNAAASALRNDPRIGSPAKVSGYLHELGLSNKTQMGTGSSGDYGGTNSKSTASDFTKFLVLLEKRKLQGVTEDNSYDRLFNFMKRASTDNGGVSRKGIVAGVGGDTEVADKPGWSGESPYAANDVGIVYKKDKPYAISILTDKPGQWDGVAKIAKSVDEMMSNSPSSSPSADCSSFGGGDLLATVKAYAWPDHYDVRVERMPAWAEVADDPKSHYVGGSQWGVRGIDCGGFVTMAMRNSGFDPNYNPGKSRTGDTPNEASSQWEYLDKNWQKISVSSTKDLQPGDVAINSKHTFLYVGKMAGFNDIFASASWSSKAPRAPMAGQGDAMSPGLYTWYRKK